MATLAKDAAAGATAAAALSAEQEALVAGFCEMTMADGRTGAHYLFTLGAGTLEAAVALYFRRRRVSPTGREKRRGCAHAARRKPYSVSMRKRFNRCI